MYHDQNHGRCYAMFLYRQMVYDIVFNYVQSSSATASDSNFNTSPNSTNPHNTWVRRIARGGQGYSKEDTTPGQTSQKSRKH